MHILESNLIIIHQISQTMDHSLLLLADYRSYADLKHTQPLHILIAQSNTTLSHDYVVHKLTL